MDHNIMCFSTHMDLTLLHSEGPKLYGALAVPSAIRLNVGINVGTP